MDDRVGDVLAQRAALSRGAGAGVALSLLLHGGLSALAIWAALHPAAVPAQRTIEIRLAPVAAAVRGTASAPVAQPPAPVAKMEKPAPPVVETRKPVAPPVVEKNTVPLSPFGKSNKKGSETATPSVATAPPAPAAVPGVGADIPVGGTGVTALEGGDFPYTLYISRMNILIGHHWYRDPNAPAPLIRVYFAIDRDGTIHDAAIETSSGNGTLDRAALRAVLESSPLPPLPFGYTGTYLGVHLSFR